MKTKRGQITLFIIIGIILIIIVSLLFFYIFNLNIQKEKEITFISKKLTVKSFVQDCIDKTSKQALILLGQQGGYIFKPEKSIDLGNLFIAYALYEGKSLLPNKKDIEEEISRYLKENLGDCADGLEIYESDFEFDEINVNTIIKQKEIRIDVDYPITIITPNSKEQINAFKTRIPIRLSYILDIVNQTIESGLDEPNWLNFALLTDSGMNTTILYYDNDKRIYIFKDTESKIDNKNYVFMFAQKSNKNLPPELFTFDEHEIKVGEELRIVAEAKDFDGDEITYSGMDTINQKTGLIRFMSSIAGIYTFKIRATDTYGDFDEEKLIIKVVE